MSHKAPVTPPDHIQPTVKCWNIIKPQLSPTDKPFLTEHVDLSLKPVLIPKGSCVFIRTNHSFLFLSHTPPVLFSLLCNFG